MLTTQEIEYQAGKLIAYAQNGEDIDRWFTSKDFGDIDSDAIWGAACLEVNITASARLSAPAT